MTNFLKKLTSRKFIASMIGVIVGVAMIFGIDGDTISSVSGAIVALGSIITFVRTEGDVDAVSAASTITSILDDATKEEGADE